jgi:protein-S-isoprenylcysteine O-methyltransferase Ste14
MRAGQDGDAKVLSILGYLLMIAGLLGLIALRSLFSPSPLVIAVQLAAVALMVWARWTFGRRSFHFAADPTTGGLVTSGPYHWVRHPIYTAVCTFAAAGALAHLSASAIACFLVILAGSVARMLTEERLLRQRYPEYSRYAARTKRMVPGLF